MFKTYIFDLDGTLVDTEELHYQAYKKALSEAGLTLPRSDFIQYWLNEGKGIAKYFKINNINEEAQKYRLLKGGSWWDCMFYGCGISAPTFNRSFFDASTKNDSFGFRCAADAK